MKLWCEMAPLLLNPFAGKGVVELKDPVRVIKQGKGTSSEETVVEINRSFGCQDSA